MYIFFVLCFLVIQPYFLGFVGVADLSLSLGVSDTTLFPYGIEHLNTR